MSLLNESKETPSTVLVSRTLGTMIASIALALTYAMLFL